MGLCEEVEETLGRAVSKQSNAGKGVVHQISGSERISLVKTEKIHVFLSIHLLHIFAFYKKHSSDKVSAE